MDRLVRNLIKNNSGLFCFLHIFSMRKRKAIVSLCAFENYLSDVVLSNIDLSQKLALLDAWRQEINNYYSGKTPVSQLGREVFSGLNGFKIERNDFISILDNIRDDLQNPSRVVSLQQYKQICDDGFGAFIKMFLTVMTGNKYEKTSEMAKHLGRAFSTTVFLRNIREDAGKGRVYLPSEYLREAGILSQNPEEIIVDKNLGKARGILSKFAQESYASALKLINQTDRKNAMRMRFLLYPYKYCFDTMEKRGWEVISPKPVITPMIRFMLMLKAVVEKRT